MSDEFDEVVSNDPKSKKTRSPTSQGLVYATTTTTSIWLSRQNETGSLAHALCPLEKLVIVLVLQLESKGLPPVSPRERGTRH